jgi:hypothetical protein
MSDSFIVETQAAQAKSSPSAKEETAISVATTLAIRSPPEATSLGVTFRSYLRGCRSTQNECQTLKADILRGG